MTITPTQFRTNFTEFANATTYPDSGVQFWLDLAYLLMSNTVTVSPTPVVAGMASGCASFAPTLVLPRWGNLLDYGAQLFTAHNLALEAQAQKASASGGVPGVNSGPLSSKSVGPVSASYDTNAGIIQDAGNYNLTTYGTRLYSLFRLVGAGGFVA